MELVWTPEARDDLLALALYYGEFDADLALVLVDRAEDGARILPERPRIGAPTKHDGIRKWLVRRTPFLLLYRVMPDTVEILRVVHGASNWRDEPPI